MKKDLTNIFSLGGMQIANAIFPLMVFPWLLGRLGVERFSALVLTESLMLLALVVVVYSFDIDGVRRLVNEKSDARLSELFFEIFWTRLLLFFASGGVLLIVISFVDRNLLVLQLAWLTYLLAYVVQQAWFFQGKEDNFIIAIWGIAGRVSGAILLVIVVRHGAPMEAIPLCIGLSYLLPALIGFIYGKRKYKLSYRSFNGDDVRRAVTAGRHIFTGNVFVYLFRGSNILILKWLSVDAAVAAYAIAEKITKCVQAGMRPINQFSFPKIARALQSSSAAQENYVLLIGRYLFPQWILLLILLLLVGFGYLAFLPELVRSYPQIKEILPLLLVMVVAVFFGVGNYIYGSCALNVLGFDRYYARAIAFVGLTVFFLSLCLVLFYADLGAAFAYVAGEALLFFVLIAKFQKLQEKYK